MNQSPSSVAKYIESIRTRPVAQSISPSQQLPRTGPIPLIADPSNGSRPYSAENVIASRSTLAENVIASRLPSFAENVIEGRASPADLAIPSRPSATDKTVPARDFAASLGKGSEDAMPLPLLLDREPEIRATGIVSPASSRTVPPVEKTVATVVEEKKGEPKEAEIASPEEVAEAMAHSHWGELFRDTLPIPCSVQPHKLGAVLGLWATCWDMSREELMSRIQHWSSLHPLPKQETFQSAPIIEIVAKNAKPKRSPKSDVRLFREQEETVPYEDAYRFAIAYGIIGPLARPNFAKVLDALQHCWDHQTSTQPVWKATTCTAEEMICMVHDNPEDVAMNKLLLQVVSYGIQASKLLHHMNDPYTRFCTQQSFKPVENASDFFKVRLTCSRTGTCF